MARAGISSGPKRFRKMDKNNKQFGLILPKSKQGASSNAKKPVANIFKQDSSSEDDETKAVVSGGTDWMKRKIASGATVNAKSGATGLGTKITSHHVLMKQKALEEDPTIFQVCSIFLKLLRLQTFNLTRLKGRSVL